MTLLVPSLAFTLAAQLQAPQTKSDKNRHQVTKIVSSVLELASSILAPGGAWRNARAGGAPKTQKKVIFDFGK